MSLRRPKWRPNTIRIAQILMSGLALVVLLAGCNLMVQPIERYESPDGLFAFDYPMQWDIVDESVDHSLTTVLIGSFPGLIEMDSIPPGEAGMGFMLLPDVVPVSRTESRQVTAEEFGTMVQTEAATVEDYAGPLEEADIEGMIGVYRFEAVSESGARAAYLFSLEDGLIAVYVLVYAADDDDTEVRKMVEDSIASFRIVGDPQEFILNAQVPNVVKP